MLETRKLRVFLCHSSNDKPAVRELYQRLKLEGWIDSWLDEEKLYPGQDWDLEIEKAVEASDAVIVFLSNNSVSKEGYVQRELRFVLRLADFKPEGTVFVIPIRLDDCPLPRRLSMWQYVDYFPENRKEWTYNRLLGSLKVRAGKLGIPTINPVEEQARKEKEAAEKTAKEKAERDAAEKAAKEKAEHEAAEKAEQERIERERLEREEKVRREAEEKAKKEKEERKEKARREKEAREKAAEEQSERDADDMAAKEKAAREAAEKVDRERIERERLEWEAKARREKEDIAGKLYYEGMIAQNQGDYDEAEKFFRQSLRIAIELNDEQGKFNIQSQIEKLNQKRPQSASEQKAKKDRETKEYKESIKRANIEQSIMGVSLMALIGIAIYGAYLVNNLINSDKQSQAENKSSIVTPTQKLVSVITSEKDGMTMVYVPAGDFEMGSEGGNDNETPVHNVYLDDFWIDQTEVANAMYAKCVDAGGCNPPKSNKSHTRDSYYDNPEFGNYPIIYMSWNDAQSYCDWAGRRLPTEAEWEKAASWDSANQKKYRYPWGKNFLDNDKCKLANIETCVGDTQEIGFYENGKSPYGVYDMAGNVYEWVSSVYMPYPYNAADGRENLESTTSRILRGGSWFSLSFLSTTTSRSSLSGALDHFGFRCAMDASE